MIHLENQGTVTILRLEHGKVNALDTELFAALQENLERVASSPAKAVVLTGAGKAFSAGVDLFRILKEGPSYVKDFVPALSEGLKKLFLFPKPLIAAVNGHAIAGGCVMTCACDYRIMAQGPGTIGLPELLVGVPFPAVALEIVRFAVAPQRLQEVVYTGRTYSPEDALRRGLIDEVSAPEELMGRAMEIARTFGEIPEESFRIVKEQLRRFAMERTQLSAEEQQKVLSAWSSPAIHNRIRSYLDRTIGKKG